MAGPIEEATHRLISHLRDGTNRVPAKPPNAGKGRTKGVPNKATANAREAIARFVDGNTERLQGWIDQIAEQDGPAAAFRCVVDLLEYHVPKLARTELMGKGGVEIVSRHVVELHEGPPPKGEEP